MILKKKIVNTNLDYVEPNNKAHDHLKYIDNRKVKSYYHFELTGLINLLFLTLRYLDNNTRVDRTVGIIKCSFEYLEYYVH